mgnify:CR=1 FL=1
MNYLRTAILLAAMTALFLAVGFMLGGESGLVIALVVAALNVTVISGVLVHAGLYMFTASVILSKLALARIKRVAVTSA